MSVGRLAVSLFGAVVFFGAAQAAEVRVEGRNDPDAQAIARGVEAYINKIEQIGTAFTFVGSAVVRSTSGAAYRLRLPRVVVETPDGPRVDFGVIEIDVTPSGADLYRFDVKPTPPVEIWADGSLVASLMVAEQFYRGIWDRRLNSVAEAELRYRNLSVEGRSDLDFSLRIDEITMREKASISANGTQVTRNATGIATGSKLSVGDLGVNASVETWSFDLDVEGLPIEFARNGALERALSPTPGGMGEQILASLRGEAGRQRISFEMEGLGFRTSSGDWRIGRLGSVQTLGEELRYTLEMDDFALVGALGELILALGHFSLSNHTRLDAGATANGQARLAYRSLQLPGPLAHHIPSVGDVELSVSGLPLARVIEQLVQQSPASSVVDPSPNMRDLLGVILRSRSMLSLDRLSLRDGTFAADLDSRAVFDLSALRFVTEGNRITVRGVGALLAALSANADENAQLIGLLSLGTAMAQTEIQDHETVHVYEFDSGPAGGILLNGRPLVGVP